MANPNGKCVICGEGPTVKSHLFPRALMLDIKAGGVNLVAGVRDQDGVLLSQNGQWDDTLLCEHHERSVGAADDYAVRFIRRKLPAAKTLPGGRMVSVENPEPDHLVHFAYAVVWRHCVCQRGRSLRLKLGPFEQHIREALISKGPYGLELLVGLSPIALNGEWIPLALAPYRERMPLRQGQFSVWHFIIGGLDFFLKTDARQFPRIYRPYLANGNNPLVLSPRQKREIHSIPKLRPLLQSMSRSTWTPPEAATGERSGTRQR